MTTRAEQDLEACIADQKHLYLQCKAIDDEQNYSRDPMWWQKSKDRAVCLLRLELLKLRRGELELAVEQERGRLTLPRA